MANSATNSILCVDIGGTSTKAGVLLPSGDVRYVDSIASEPDADSFLENLASLIGGAFDRVTKNEPRPSQLGIAIAGFLDTDRTSLLYNSNLPWLEGYPLRRRLRERFPDLEIELEVDSNAAAMAEYRFGTGQGKSRFLCLTCGTGLGVGMIVDGVPLRFAYGCMGDVGHTIVQRDGPLCTCGGRGCAEI